MRRRALLTGLGALSAGCVFFEPSIDPETEIIVSNSADFPVEYTLEIRDESSALVFSDTATIEPGEVKYYADVLGSERYVATVTFDDGTSDQHGWDRTEGTVLDVTLHGRDAEFNSEGTF